MQKMSGGLLAHLDRLSIKTRRIDRTDAILILVGVAFAILVRYPLLTFKSADFLNSLKDWYVTIRGMGFSAFATGFTSYNPPYLYELYLIARFFPDTTNVLATKIPSLVADFIAAIFVYQLVRLRYAQGPFPALATSAFLLAPTVVLNSAFWGQADILYTAPLIACLLFLMRKQNLLAMLAYGIALAFKLQAIFLAPLLLGLLLRGTFSLRHALVVPLVLLAALVPAAVAGRPIPDLLLVYVSQAELYQLLQMSAATVYTWMPDYGLTQRYFTLTGVVFTLALSSVLAILVQRAKTSVTPAFLLRLFLLCFLLIPFFLPKMHDRYFFPADVLSLIFAFYFPRFYFVPIVIILSSFFAYQPTLFGVETVPMEYLAIGIFGMLVIVARETLRMLLTPDLERNPISTAVELEM